MKDMNIFEVNQHLRAIVNNGFSVDLETGELLFDESSLNDLENTKAEKLLSIGKMIKEKEAFAKSIKDQEKVMAERRKYLENEITRLKDWALSNMTDKEKFEDSQIKVSYSKGSESVEVLDLEKLDPKYVVEKYTHTADKKALKEALKGGKFIEGVTLVRKPSLRLK
jgi:hypothetical protein